MLEVLDTDGLLALGATLAVDAGLDVFNFFAGGLIDVIGSPRDIRRG